MLTIKQLMPNILMKKIPFFLKWTNWKSRDKKFNKRVLKKIVKVAGCYDELLSYEPIIKLIKW